jgi:hypothetical protein
MTHPAGLGAGKVAAPTTNLRSLPATTMARPLSATSSREVTLLIALPAILLIVPMLVLLLAGRRRY